MKQAIKQWVGGKAAGNYIESPPFDILSVNSEALSQKHTSKED